MEGDTMKWCLIAMVILKRKKYAQKCKKFCINSLNTDFTSKDKIKC